MGTLSRFQIIELYGYRNVDIQIEDNTFIIVGENGMGKTTILKFMLSILSGECNKLPYHKFRKIVVTIDNRNYELNYSDISSQNVGISLDKLRMLPLVIRHELLELGHPITKNDILYVCNKRNYPIEKIFNYINEKSMAEQLYLFDNEINVLKEISEAMNSKILYLPTYRRIEEDLPNVIKGRYSLSREDNAKKIFYNENSENDNCGYIELVEFGMEDVKDKIDSIYSELSKFSESQFKNLAYMNLGDVIDKNYVTKNNDPITETDIEKFKLCLSRSSKTMLSDKQIKTLLNNISKEDFNPSDTHSQILLYYFRKLLSLQNDLEMKEQSIIDFCNMCNNYFNMSDKEIIYEISTFKVTIWKYHKNKRDEIHMSELSSGEKQIVSVFSQLFLSGEKDFFVIIDEPELSLSVPWQKQFLNDIKRCKSCVGLVAATHSPFIYDNQLFQYTHSLGEYIKEVE